MRPRRADDGGTVTDDGNNIMASNRRLPVAIATKQPTGARVTGKRRAGSIAGVWIPCRRGRSERRTKLVAVSESSAASRSAAVAAGRRLGVVSMLRIGPRHDDDYLYSACHAGPDTRARWRDFKCWTCTYPLNIPQTSTLK